MSDSDSDSDSDSASGARNPSLFNNEDDIKCTVEFTALATTKKKRKQGAKGKTTTILFFFHEDNSFLDFMEALDKRIKATYEIQYCIVAQQLCPDNFSINYTIPYSSAKNIGLLSTDDWGVLIKKIMKKSSGGSQSGLLKIFITAKKVCDCMLSIF